MQQVSQTNFKVDTELPNKRAAQNKPSMVGRCFHLLNEKCEWKNLNYYLSYDVCPSASASVCLSASANFLMGADIKKC